MDLPFTLIGLIWMVVLGPAVGNYLCSVVYRLPLGRTPFERHPYCGHCNADLKPKDLFPILSWLSTKGRCRYCSGPIPAIYMVIEVACMVWFVATFLTFGVGEEFLLVTAFGTFVIALAAIEWREGWLSSSLYGYAFMLAALYSTLLEGGIFGWISSFITIMVAALALLWVVSKLRRVPLKPFEANWIWWLGLLAVMVPLPMQAAAVLLLLSLPLAFRPTRFSAPVYAALLLLLALFPAI